MVQLPVFNQYQIILASQSPRRQNLLKEIVPHFTIEVRDTKEDFPDNLSGHEIAVYLAKLKASAFNSDIKDNQLVITADTIVWINNEVLGKPIDRNDAIRILKILSGNMHKVYTGVCLKTKSIEKTFWSESEVYFHHLDDYEISYYVDEYKPYDKAGAYGVQEWIGYIGIERINGSYFNVMGLPIHKLYNELKKFG
jgi:septum formation protein